MCGSQESLGPCRCPPMMDACSHLGRTRQHHGRGHACRREVDTISQAQPENTVLACMQALRTRAHWRLRGHLRPEGNSNAPFHTMLCMYVQNPDDLPLCMQDVRHARTGNVAIAGLKDVSLRPSLEGEHWQVWKRSTMSMQDITHARTGDIVAIAGLKDVTTGDTLCDEKHPIVLERMEFPDPVIKVCRHLLAAITECSQSRCLSCWDCFTTSALCFAHFRLSLSR